MILIDALYLVSPGGISLLEYLLTQLEKHSGEYFLLVDKRYNGHLDKYRIEYQKLNNSEISRYFFYKKRIPKIKSVLCLANVPPPVKLSIPVHIYFHNLLLIDSSFSKLVLHQKSSLFLKRLYIRLKNNEKYLWHVQTSLIKKKLIKSFKIEENLIKITPFFKPLYGVKEKKIKNISFIYVASSEKHKNHRILLKGFTEASCLTKNKMRLYLTLDHQKTKSFKEIIKKSCKNFEIVLLGSISKDKLIKFYLKNDFLIYPSLKESFGLPLIEATQLGLNIIASDLPYTYEVINPSLTFNPLSVESIKKTILDSVQNKNIPKPTLKIKNQIDELINQISKDV